MSFGEEKKKNNNHPGPSHDASFPFPSSAPLASSSSPPLPPPPPPSSSSSLSPLSSKQQQEQEEQDRGDRGDQLYVWGCNDCGQLGLSPPYDMIPPYRDNKHDADTRGLSFPTTGPVSPSSQWSAIQFSSTVGCGCTRDGEVREVLFQTPSIYRSNPTSISISISNPYPNPDISFEP